MKKIIALLYGLMPLLLLAQVTMTAQLQPSGIIQKDQLWNLLLVNNSSGSLHLKVRMNLQDAATGQVAMSASTGTFTTGQGVKIISERDLHPIDYNYNSPAFSRNYLPSGIYVACYELYNVPDNSQPPLAQDCASIRVEPLGPPMLNFPPDQSEVPTTHPHFNWIPPTPASMFNNLNYDITLAELLSGQVPQDAILYNSPIYTRSGISQPNDNYPTTMSGLDSSKTYVWQVVARDANNYAAHSEVWTFNIKGHKGRPDKERGDSVYMHLYEDFKGTYTVSKNELAVKYFSYEELYTADIKISEDDDTMVQANVQEIKSGDNYFKIKLLKPLKKDKLYKLKLKDKAEKIHVLRFHTK